MKENIGVVVAAPIVPVENSDAVIAVPAGSPAVPLLLVNVLGQFMPFAGPSSDAVCGALSKFTKTMV